MKSFPNKQTSVDKTANSEEGKMFYSDLINVCLNQPKQGGLSYDDIEKRLSIGKAVKESNGEISLEDADHKYLVELIKSTRWNKPHEDLLSFRDDVINASKS